MAKKSIRFSVTDGKGNRASTWLLVSSKSPKNDVYLICRETGHAIKSSLHESGQWHYAYLKNFFDEKIEDIERIDKDRFIDKWRRPAEIAPGVTLALRIVMPWSSITTQIDETTTNKVLWVSNPSEGHAIEFCIIFTKQSTLVTDWPGKNNMGTQLVGSLKLNNGDTVWVVYQEIDMPQVTNQSVNLKFFKGRGKEDLVSQGLRMIAYTTEEDGSRVFYDFVVEFMEKDTQQIS